MTAAVIDLATRRVLPKGFLVGGIAATTRRAPPAGGDLSDLIFPAIKRARAIDALVGAIDAVMRIPAPALWVAARKAEGLKKWRTGIVGCPNSQRFGPHIKGWEAKLAADEARLRAALKPRKAKLN